jgi:hypothetical protein
MAQSLFIGRDGSREALLRERGASRLAGMGAGAPLRRSMSPAKTIDEAFRPSSDRDPSHFLASDQPGPALIG